MTLFAKFHALGLAFKDQQPKQFEEAANSLEVTHLNLLVVATSIFFSRKLIFLKNFVNGI